MKHACKRNVHRLMSAIRVGSNVLDVLMILAAVGCVAMLLIYGGFEHAEHDRLRLLRGIRVCQWVFIVNVLYNIVLTPARWRRSQPLRWVVDIAMLITVLPLLYPHPEHPWIPWLERLLYSHMFTFVVLVAYAMFGLSYGAVRLLGKRTNPSLILSCSFLFFILVGSFVLMMPKCTFAPIEYIDSLFVASSAVCITGLTTVDVSSTFTPLGLLVLGALMQIGALGVMTFTSFFALFFSGNVSIYNQLMVRDMIYSKSLNALLPTLLYIFVATISIEAIGAVMIGCSIHGRLGMSLHDEMVFSAFMSISSFCNAGFSNLPQGMANTAILHGSQWVYWVMTLMVMTGALGFPILVNFKDIFKEYAMRLWHRIVGTKRLNRTVHIYDVNTRIVLVTTSVIFVLGAALFYICERHNSLEGMTEFQAITQSVFNACTPRSAGFVSVNPATFLDVTILIVMFQMWIGGGSQSTAGGIKVNTFAAICLNLRSVILGRERVTAFKRTISIASIRRANAVVALSIMAYAIFTVILVALEPDLPVRDLMFESLSAVATVGSSLGVTPMLSTASKLLLCSAMFLGRVGIISLLVGVTGNRKDVPARYPIDNIIIN